MKRSDRARRAARLGVVALAFAFVASSVGCAVGDGYRSFRDTLAGELPSLVAETGIADRIESRVSDKLGQGVGAAAAAAFERGVESLSEAVQKSRPEAPPGDPVSGGVGTLLALLVANAARGMIRQRNERKKATS